MKILLVEDEPHKRDELVDCVADVFSIVPVIVDGVSTAVTKVLSESFDLIILDMALSTFGEGADDNQKGHDQAQGGIEVLRALKAKKRNSKILIVTQYHNFYIGGVSVKLKNSQKIIKEKYQQDVIGAVLYQYKSMPTRQKIKAILKANA